MKKNAQLHKLQPFGMVYSVAKLEAWFLFMHENTQTLVKKPSTSE